MESNKNKKGEYWTINTTRNTSYISDTTRELNI